MTGNVTVHSSKYQTQFTAYTALAKTSQELSIILRLLHIIFEKQVQFLKCLSVYSGAQ